MLCVMLEKLPDLWETFKKIEASKSIKDMSLSNLERAILKEASSKKRKASPVNFSAFSHSKITHKRQKSVTDRTQRFQCENCGGNHESRKCFKIKCTGCSRPRHQWSECWLNKLGTNFRQDVYDKHLTLLTEKERLEKRDASKDSIHE
jgi:hypothetical protein